MHTNMNNGTAKRKRLTSARARTGEHEAGSFCGGGSPSTSLRRLRAGPTNTPSATDGEVKACPECQGELETAHHSGNLYAPECSYPVCLDCGWQGEPE